MNDNLLESVYQRCLEHELLLRAVAFVAPGRLPVVYKGVALGDDLVMDLFFPGRLVVELKATERIEPIHEAQLLTYLRLSGTRVGLIINFNVRLLKDGLKRMVL